MLHVLCRVGQDAYAIPCDAVDRVLPFAQLKALPGAQRGLVGLLDYRGQPYPVIDLSLLLAGQPAREAFGTRILLCPVEGLRAGKIGIVAEGVSEVVDLDEAAFQSAGAQADPAVSGVVPGREGLIQRIEVPGILPSEILASLDLSEEYLTA